MAEEWRRFGWQQMELVAPMDWYLSKIGIERLEGEVWLADSTMPRLQIKWHNAAKAKSVDTKSTLDRYLLTLERSAKKRKLDLSVERDTKLVGRRGRDVSSMECFHWVGDVEAHGLVWYSPEAERVTMAQVSGPVGEDGLKSLARRVLSSLNDAPTGDADLWTAFDLECHVPRTFQLSGQRMETGRTELSFQFRKDSLVVARYGLAEVALQRAGDLGDWAHEQRFKSWSAYRLERDESAWSDHASVRFDGIRRSPVERARAATYNFVGLPYSVRLAARCWHCEESNALFLVEHYHDRRSEPLLDALCQTIPCRPQRVPTPKG